ncbi:traB domain-containing protein-like [Littorina saxatilis]|uniref:TraB domain-containing protein n=1 Tax=Littorina saxatilis TaxID=31220 RepID=A0AAN9GBT3_9CAEN
MADDIAEGLRKREVKTNPAAQSGGDSGQSDSQKTEVAAATNSSSTMDGHGLDATKQIAMNGVLLETDSKASPEGSAALNGSMGDTVRSAAQGKQPVTGRDQPVQRYEDFENGDEEDDDDVDDDDWVSEEGEESDVEDNVELAFPVRRRESNPVLPDTVTLLEAHQGCKVYVIGTAHFSTESQEDVSKVIQAVQPDVVMVELCKSRINILELDEKMLLEEAKNINLAKFRMAVKQSGVVQGIMHLLLLSMSAHLTKQLGMAPGGEFRRAFQEARRVPGCRLQLGDRPIQITLKRALGALTVWQKLKLAWYLITSKDPISKEDVEKCKQRDLLEQLLKEMTGEFPALSRVFVEERDVYLAHSLKMAARPREYPDRPEISIPSVVVGVVGIGHVPGIVANWPKEQDIKDIMTIPPGSILGKVFKWSIRASLLCIMSYGCYRLYRWTSHAVL